MWLSITIKPNTATALWRSLSVTLKDPLAGHCLCLVIEEVGLKFVQSSGYVSTTTWRVPQRNTWRPPRVKPNTYRWEMRPRWSVSSRMIWYFHSLGWPGWDRDFVYHEDSKAIPDNSRIVSPRNSIGVKIHFIQDMVRDGEARAMHVEKEE